MNAKYRKRFALVASLGAWVLVTAPAAQAAHQCQPQQVQIGTEQIQTGTKQVQIGTSTVPVYEQQPVYSTVAVYEQQPVYGSVPVYETVPVYSTRYVPAVYGTRSVPAGEKIVGYKDVVTRGYTVETYYFDYFHTNFWKSMPEFTCWSKKPITACGQHGTGWIRHEMGGGPVSFVTPWAHTESVPIYGPAYRTESYLISAGYVDRYQVGTKQVKVGTEQVQTGSKQVKVGTEQVQTGTKQVRVGTSSVPVYEERPVYATVPVYDTVCTPIPDTEQPVLTYTLTYSANGGLGAVPPSVVANAGSTISLAGAGSLYRSGYSFAGWALTPSGSVSGSVPLNSNVTVYAIWSPVATTVATYSVRYNANGGANPPASSTVESGGEFVAAAGTGMTAPAGKRFAGWNSSSAGSGTAYTPGALYSPRGNINLYAVWVSSGVVRPS